MIKHKYGSTLQIKTSYGTNAIFTVENIIYLFTVEQCYYTL